MSANIESVKVEISVVLGRPITPCMGSQNRPRGRHRTRHSGRTTPLPFPANERALAKGDIVIRGSTMAVSVSQLLKSYELNTVHIVY